MSLHMYSDVDGEFICHIIWGIPYSFKRYRKGSVPITIKAGTNGATTLSSRMNLSGYIYICDYIYCVLFSSRL